MMSLAWFHCPSRLGWPSAVRGGFQLGSSLGGFLGSIQPGGGGFFGGGGPCAATWAVTVPAINAVIMAARNRALMIETLLNSAAPADGTRCRTYSTRIPGVARSSPGGDTESY